MSNLNARMVTLVDLQAGRAVYNIANLETPVGVVIDPETHRVYVLNRGANIVSVVDPETGQFLANIKLAAAATEEWS